MTQELNTIDFGTEEVSFGSSPAKLIADETRIPVIVSSITIIGNEVFKDKTTGKETVSFKIGIGFTSNVRRVSEDGEDLPGTYTFYEKFTASTHSKGAMHASGILDVIGTGWRNLSALVSALLGKQMTAMTSHRKYKDKQGNEKTAVDLEKFKKIEADVDFTEALETWEVPFLAAKMYPEASIVNMDHFKSGGKPYKVKDLVKTSEVSSAEPVKDLEIV